MSSNTNSTSNTLSIGSMDYQIMLVAESNDGVMNIICTQDAMRPPKVIPSVSYKSKAKVDYGKKPPYLTNDTLQQTLRGRFDPRTLLILENSRMKHNEIRCFYRVAAIFDPIGAVYAECSRITEDVCKTETYRFLDNPHRGDWTIDLITRWVIEDELLK